MGEHHNMMTGERRCEGWGSGRLNTQRRNSRDLVVAMIWHRADCGMVATASKKTSKPSTHEAFNTSLQHMQAFNTCMP